ncbi:MAG TPA: hypothetical protein VHT03_01900 [Rhizomicrobium sp.]|nr:hypothetical protein [Rhizomicrobium sp.]
MNAVTPLSISHLPPNAPWWIFGIVVAALALHIGGGSIGILSGYTAVFVRKGGHLHRLFGTLFVVAMLAMGIMGLALSVWIRQFGNIAGGTLATYLVATAWLTVKRKPGTTGRIEVALFVAVLATAGLLFSWGRLAAISPKHSFQGYGAALYYVFGSFAALFAALDLKVLLRGGVSGVSRLARHLWRMCFALFFAAASFFLGQQKVMPAFMHGSPLLFIPAFAPLVLMIVWLVRVRFAKRLTQAASKLRVARTKGGLEQLA